MIFHFNVILVFAKKCNFHPFTPSLKAKKWQLLQQISKNVYCGCFFNLIIFLRRIMYVMRHYCALFLKDLTYWNYEWLFFAIKTFTSSFSRSKYPMRGGPLSNDSMPPSCVSSFSSMRAAAFFDCFSVVINCLDEKHTSTI